MSEIMGFVKMCRKRKFADDFRNGVLYSNRISWHGQNGNDLLEGVTLIPPNRIELKCNGVIVDGLAEDMCGSAELRSPHVQNLNVFCMYTIDTGDFEFIGPENLQAFKKHLEIDDRCFDTFGDHAVIVHNRNEFLTRVDKAISRNGFRIRRGLITYFESGKQPAVPYNSFNAAFLKRDKYNYENEYRIAIDKGVPGDDPLPLEIGDISDITSYCNSRDINRTIEVRIPKSD